jgi:hypothetical protein
MELLHRFAKLFCRHDLVLVLVRPLQEFLDALRRALGNLVRRDLAVMVLVQPLEQHARFEWARTAFAFGR